MGGACRMNWEKRNVYKVLSRKLEGKRSRGGLRSRLKVILKCILEENGEMV
jgi:hypothetical protein